MIRTLGGFVNSYHRVVAFNVEAQSAIPNRNHSHRRRHYRRHLLYLLLLGSGLKAEDVLMFDYICPFITPYCL